MTFKGVLGQGDNQIKVLPDGSTEKVNAGDTYKVAYAAEYEGIDAYVGDLIIADSDQGESDETYQGNWIHISSGYEDSYAPQLSQELDSNNNNTTIKLTGGAGEDSGKAVIAGSDNIKFKLNSSNEIQIDLVWGTL